MKVGNTYKITGLTLRELKYGERLKRKNGKKLIRRNGSKRITITDSGWIKNPTFSNDDGWWMMGGA